MNLELEIGEIGRAGMCIAMLQSLGHAAIVLERNSFSNNAQCGPGVCVRVCVCVMYKVHVCIRYLCAAMLQCVVWAMTDVDRWVHCNAAGWQNCDSDGGTRGGRMD